MSRRRVILLVAAAILLLLAWRLGGLGLVALAAAAIGLGYLIARAGYHRGVRSARRGP
jgi:hypothetical protein